MSEPRLRWVKIDGKPAWEAALPYGRGACYTIYRKGRRYTLVYWSGASAICAHFGPYSTIEGAKRAAKRDQRW